MRTVLGMALLAAGLAAWQLADTQVLAQDKGTVVDFDGLTSKAPANWKKEEVKSQFRAYQFLVPKVEGDPADASLIVYYFGKGGGGGVDANIERWQKMFEPPKGKKLDDVSSVEKFKVGDVEVVVLDVKGTYLEKFPPFAPNAKITRKEDYRMLGVIFDKGPFYIRFVGPERTVNSNKKAFIDWLKAFK